MNEDFYIDASSFIQLCLRGIDYDKTSYSALLGLATSAARDEVYHSGELLATKWGIDPYKYRNYRWAIYETDSQFDPPFGNHLYNECGTLAKWMVDMGWRLDTFPNLTTQNNLNLTALEPGDIIFFAEQSGFQDMKFPLADQFKGYNYRNITHAAICSNVNRSLDTMVGDIVFFDGTYYYAVEIINIPSIVERYLKVTSSHFEYNGTMIRYLTNQYKYTNTQGLSYYLPAFDTIACICRPQLASTGLSDLEIQAQQLGLHVVPENYAQLNIVKNCRLCSDIEWTPAIDYDRPMPLTGNENDYFQAIGSHGWESECVSIMVDGKFTAGKKYKGMPWTKKPYPNQVSYNPIYSGLNINLNPELFLSIIGNEDSPVYIDETDNKVYPIYGWNEPVDLVRFVFGETTYFQSDTGDGVPQPGYYPNAFKYNALNDNGFPTNGISTPEGIDHLDPNTLKLGDVISGYSIYGIVTDIIRDEEHFRDEEHYGLVKYIELTEATRFGLMNNDYDGPNGNLIRRKLYTPSELLAWYGIHREDAS